MMHVSSIVQAKNEIIKCSNENDLLKKSLCLQKTLHSDLQKRYAALLNLDKPFNETNQNKKRNEEIVEEREGNEEIVEEREGNEEIVEEKEDNKEIVEEKEDNKEIVEDYKLGDIKKYEYITIKKIKYVKDEYNNIYLNKNDNIFTYIGKCKYLKKKDKWKIID